MQRQLAFKRQSDEETVKEMGLILDYDEIARKGGMSKEEASISKWYGIYKSRQGGDHMARAVVPGGQLTTVEARALAAISRKYAQGLISFTTRQAAQFHRLQLGDLASFLREIHKVDMSTFHGCGDVNRNVAACPWASICPHRRIDVLPYAKATSDFMSACRDLDNLPRKFKITFSGCSGGCGQPDINCVGVTAVVRRGADGSEEAGFQVRIGGGLGWAPFIASTLYTFIPPEDIARVCRAVAIFFRENGDRMIRMFARLKFVVHRKGMDWCRAEIERILDEEGVDHSRFETAPIEDIGPAVPDRPLRATAPLDRNGHAIVRIRIPKGELKADALHRIAEISERYADKFIYSTNRQNLELHGIAPQLRETVEREIQTLDLKTSGFFSLQDVVSCVGTTYCPLAVTRTHDLFDRLQPLVNDDRFAAIRDRALINIAGCPNACGQYRIADIGFRGMRIREQHGAVESYQITLGGQLDRLGDILGEYKLADCIPVTEAVLNAFIASRADAPEGETLAAHVERVGIGPYQTAVAALNIAYDKAPNPTEYSVPLGDGEADLDMATIAKDVPCQNGCPARTNVPEYIRHIAKGNPLTAHRINQECNVLPGILGRICVRPCEEDCRYQWTSSRGPVRICHLKRFAADTKAVPSAPLPAWFDATGRKVAVIGGGPAGLAAARELKRYGHAVTIIERAPYLGGQIRSGIPEFRLPRAVLNEDIDAIIHSGIQVSLNETVDAARLEQMETEYDAVLVSIGANRPRRLNLEGAGGLGIEGLEFMRAYNDDEAVTPTGDVLIIGGGFTAVDCARAARRLMGPEANISIMYRRGKAEMAATEEEHRELEQEGVAVQTLVTPARAIMENGKLTAVVFRRNVLGDPGEDGRATFIAVEDSEFSVPCGTLIEAIGQTQETGILPEGYAVNGGRRIPDRTVFLAGDYAIGNSDVIHAVADGKEAADEIDTFLMGEKRRRTVLRIQEAETIDRLREQDLVYPPEMPTLPVDQRQGNEEVETGFTPEGGDTHAWRCYLCNHKFEIDQDKCIHCDWCIRVSPRECIRRLSELKTDDTGAPIGFTEVPASEPEKATYIWIDSDNCIRCGNCKNICPTGAISLRKADRVACGGVCE